MCVCVCVCVYVHEGAREERVERGVEAARKSPVARNCREHVIIKVTKIRDTVKTQGGALGGTTTRKEKKKKKGIGGEEAG